jgi:essential nuclear protein 1
MPKTSKRRRRIVDPVLGQSSSSKTAHDPLGQQILHDEEAGQYAAAAAAATANRRSKDDASDDEDYDDEKRVENSAPSSSSNSNVVLDGRSSRRILEMSRAQRLEEERVEEIAQRRRRARQQQQQPHELVGGRRRNSSNSNKRGDHSASSDSDGDESHDDDEADEDPEQHDDWVRHDDQGYVSVVIDGAAPGGASTSAVDNAAAAPSAMSKEDLDLIESMMNPTAERRTLADLILDKIDERQKEMQQQQQQSNKSNNNDSPPELPPKVVHVYAEIGKMLSRYTAGKLPKAFKVIPSLSNWQDVLWLTRPDLWTPQAMYAATRIFASNLNPKMAQQFYHLVLLDAVRNDIHFNKKLNYHYYMSLKKSIYKPSSFFKGILLPLVEPDAADACTLREAIIVASVLQRVSIPVHHAAVAIHKLAQSSSSSTSSSSKDPPHACRTAVCYSGPVSIFLRVLLNKKYSLPAPVIDSVVSYFASFLRPTRLLSSSDGTGSAVTGADGSNVLLPVLWHQALLVFVQRYKDEIRTSPHAMQQIKLVLKKHYHAKLTPEIRRELLGGQQAYQEEEERQLRKQKGDKEEDMAVDEEEEVEPTLPAPMDL